MTPAEVLRAAREKIATPERWTKGVFARDTLGEAVPYRAADAVCFCLRGAILRVDTDWPDIWEAERLVHVAVGTDDAAGWNDDEDRTHSEVLAAFDKAIALAEQP